MPKIGVKKFKSLIKSKKNKPKIAQHSLNEELKIDAIKTLSESEPKNVKARIESGQSSVFKAITIVIKQLGINFEKTISGPEYNIDQYKIVSFIQSWKGYQKPVKDQEEYKDKAVNWLNGRRAPVYGQTLFPMMLKKTIEYCKDVSLQIHPNDKALSKILAEIFICASVQALCQAKVTLNDMAGEKPLICQNSFKQQLGDDIKNLIPPKYAMRDGVISSITHIDNYFKERQIELMKIYLNRQNGNNDNTTESNFFDPDNNEFSIHENMDNNNNNNNDDSISVDSMIDEEEDEDAVKQGQTSSHKNYILNNISYNHINFENSNNIQLQSYRNQLQTKDEEIANLKKKMQEMENALQRLYSQNLFLTDNIKFLSEDNQNLSQKITMLSQSQKLSYVPYSNCNNNTNDKIDFNEISDYNNNKDLFLNFNDALNVDKTTSNYLFQSSPSPCYFEYYPPNIGMEFNELENYSTPNTNFSDSYNSGVRPMEVFNEIPL